MSLNTPVLTDGCQLLPGPVPLPVPLGSRNRKFLLRDYNRWRRHSLQLPNESYGSLRNGPRSLYLRLQVRSDVLPYDHTSHFDYDEYHNYKWLHADCK